MVNLLIISLKAKLDSLAMYGGLDAEVKRNVLKEELQFYVLNFIYHHNKYNIWTMYGGSALRICHGLKRMSVDLDFEVDTPVTNKYLNKIKHEIEKHFESKYGFDKNLLRVATKDTRGLELRFLVGDTLDLGLHSKQVIVKIDLNHFVALKIVNERVPINHDQLLFVIKTYNLSALMASKIVAIFLRGERGIGSVVYQEKGRDIYDLLWYMGQKIIPDLDYLLAKKLEFSDVKELFNKLTLKMNEVSDANLKQDLTPLFVDQNFIQNWLEQWHDTYIRLFEAYKISTATKLDKIIINHYSLLGIYAFIFEYGTEEGSVVRFRYNLTEDWITFDEGDLHNIILDNRIIGMIEMSGAIVGQERKEKQIEQLHKYVILFLNKIEDYLKKTNHDVFSGNVITKIIRMFATNFDRKEQIVLTKSALIDAEIEDLLK